MQQPVSNSTSLPLLSGLNTTSAQLIFCVSFLLFQPQIQALLVSHTNLFSVILFFFEQQPLEVAYEAAKLSSLGALPYLSTFSNYGTQQACSKLRRKVIKNVQSNGKQYRSLLLIYVPVSLHGLLRRDWSPVVAAPANRAWPHPSENI